jgi:hypothetical protein
MGTVLGKVISESVDMPRKSPFMSGQSSTGLAPLPDLVLPPGVSKPSPKMEMLLGRAALERVDMPCGTKDVVIKPPLLSVASYVGVTSSTALRDLTLPPGSPDTFPKMGTHTEKSISTFSEVFEVRAGVEERKMKLKGMFFALSLNILKKKDEVQQVPQDSTNRSTLTSYLGTLEKLYGITSRLSETLEDYQVEEAALAFYREVQMQFDRIAQIIDELMPPCLQPPM